MNQPMTDKGSHHEPPVVWHPRVHRYFGEQLYYFLFRMAHYDVSRPNEDSESSFALIHNLLNKNLAYGHCLYEIFGDADILARVWLDSERYQSVSGSLRTESRIKTTTVFISDREEYLWAKKLGPQREITTLYISIREDEITEYSEMKKRSDLLESPRGLELYQKLVDEGLILKSIPPTASSPCEHEKLKFFTYFNLTPRLTANPGQVLLDIEERRKTLSTSADGMSIYFGTGAIGNLLLKATVTNYYDIFSLLVGLFPSAFLESSTSTYLVASRSWHESDDLISAGAKTTPPLRRIFAFTNIPNEVIANLSEKDSRYKQLLQAMDAISPLLTLDEERFLPILVGGLLDNDARAIKMGTTFLYDIEMLMKDYFYYRLRKTYSVGDFTTKVEKDIEVARSEASGKQAEGRKAEYIPPANLGQFTLKDYYVFLGRLCREKDVAEDLGDTWKKDGENASDIRNKFAHGKIADPIGQWSAIMRQLASALMVYYRLRQWKDRLLPQSESTEN